MIHNVEKANSCVKRVRFNHVGLNQMFAYLREREEILRREIKQATGEGRKAASFQRMTEIENVLIWMVVNLEAFQEQD